MKNINKILILFLLLVIIILFIGDYNLIIKENFTYSQRKNDILNKQYKNHVEKNNLESLTTQHKNHEMSMKRELESYGNMKKQDCNEAQTNTLSSKGDRALYNSCNIQNNIKERSQNFKF
tara:strand:- start:1192 stop:1551 length:360 start_codon:yes stop_codon:yes gene_type:complete